MLCHAIPPACIENRRVVLIAVPTKHSFSIGRSRSSDSGG